MPDKMEWSPAKEKARELLQGKKTKGANFMKLASALRKGNTTARNNIIGKYAVAHGAPAAAAVAAGVAVADAVANNKTAKNKSAKKNKTSKITSANRKAGKEALNAALLASALTRKAGMAQASRYAKLLKDGKANNAKAYLDEIIKAAAENGAKAAAKAAVKVAKKNATAVAKAAKNTTVKITSGNRKNAKKLLNAALLASASTRKAGAAQAARYAKLLKDGKANNAKAYLDEIIEAGKAPKKDAKKAPAAAAVAALAGKKNMSVNNRNLALLMGAD